MAMVLSPDYPCLLWGLQAIYAGLLPRLLECPSAQQVLGGSGSDTTTRGDSRRKAEAGVCDVSHSLRGEMGRGRERCKVSASPELRARVCVLTPQGHTVALSDTPAL